MNQTEQILNWWDESQTRQKLISINALEVQAGVGRGTFQYFLNKKRNLPEHHLNSLINILKLVGFNINSN